MKLFRRNEFYVACTILALGLLIQGISGQFFTANNITDLARSVIVPGILGLGTMMVLISGNIDISFPAISMLSMYAVIKWFIVIHYQGPVALGFILCALLGALLGALNGILAAWLKLPTLIITLGTGSIYLGFMQAVLKSSVISVLPPSVASLSKLFLFTVYNTKQDISSSLPAVFLFLPVIGIILFFVMQYTMLGRGVYALGGDSVACERAGFNVARIRIFVFTLMGMISGVAGLVRVVLTGMVQPTTLIGYELSSIAAVVLGGVSLSGGKGTISGSLLGVMLLTMITNSLILMGIPSYWSKFVTGILIVVGIGITSFRTLRAKRRVNAVIPEN
ncbi:MAG: ABC transporter permease [Spirochaetaceae bacterium]|jgi:simple sugar transport system permease protein|nr:ABC transporter permease [Spirochaetaceae bacterium]